MKFFAILLCMAIGSVSGELQRRKFGKEKLEVTEDVNETRSLISLDDRRNPYSSEESLRVKYAQDNSFDQIAANAKDADPVEKKTSRNLSSLLETSTVEPTSPKAIKRNLVIMYIRKPARKEANPESKSRKYLRTKRMVGLEDPTTPVESFRVYVKNVREKLPEQLRIKMRKTDEAEEKLLTSYATSKGDTSNLVAEYNSAKSAEREQLKVDATGSGATKVIDNYKALRKGKPWNYIKLRGKLEGFFGKPSPSLTEYETLKKDEVASIDSLLGGSNNTESGKAKNVPPQEKEKPAEEKATNAQTQEKETPTDEKDWMSTYPAEHNPKEIKKRGGDDNADKDSHMFDTWIDPYLKATDFNDDLGTNLRIYEYLRQDIKVPMWNTDEAEKALLGYSRDAVKFRKAYLDIYYEYRRKEIEALKAHLAKKSEKLRERILFYYKSRPIRRGVPCACIRFLPRGFFKGSVPKPAVDKYLAVKKEELYTDQYLDGSMKIGEVPKKDENASVEACERASNQAESKKNHRIIRAEVAQVARAEEDEKAEEMERGVRAKETETVEYDAYRENVEKIFATSDDAKEDVEVHGSPDNVTSADVRNTETTTDNTESEKDYRKLRAEVAQAARAEENEKSDKMERKVRATETEKVRSQVVYAVDWENERVVARAIEDEKAEEMERGVRAKETETVEEVAYAIDRENEKTVATTDDETKETTNRYKSHDNDVNEARSPISFDDGKNTYTSDESLRVNNAQDNSFDQIAANTKDADSVEKKTPRGSSPMIETSTVKPTSSKAIKKNLEIMYLGKPAKYFKELREIARRNSTESKTLKEISVNFLKRLLASTEALSRKETNLASNSGKFLRRKREAPIEDPPNAMASLKVCAQLRKKLPVALRIKMLDTDETEEKLVLAYAASKQNIGLISNYNSAKLLKRDQLRRSLAAAGSGATELMKTYRTLRKGTPWNCIKKRGLFRKFFAKPSDALTEYEALKRDELSTDGFLTWFREIANRAEVKENAIKENVEEVRAERSKEARMRREPKAKKDEPETKKDEPKKKDEPDKKKDEPDKKKDEPDKKKDEPEKKKDEPEKKKDEPRKKKDDKDDQFTTGRPKMEVGEVRDDQDTAESRDEYLKLSEVFKEQLKMQLKNTDEAEKVILLSYVQSDYAPDDLLDDYYAERKKEIEQLKADLAEAGQKSSELLAMYKSIRKGTVWNFLKSGSKQRKDFFKRSSAGRTEYEALKKKELDIDRYLDGKIPIEDKAPARDDKAVAEGIQRASAIEEDKAKQEEEGTEATETASKNGDDPPNAESSLMVQKDIQSKLSEWLAGRITVTNTAEEALLDSYAESTTASANLLADYNDAKAKEREVLKLEMAGEGPQEAQMLVNYKKLRKGSPWNSLKLQDKYKTFFETPSAALTEYEDVKRDELSIDLFLNGENAVTVGNGIVQGANGNMVTRYANRRARAKAAREDEEDEEIQREVRAKETENVRSQVVYAVDWENERVVARAKEDEKAEEMERGVRAKETETVEVEYDAYRENVENIVATSDDAKEDVEVHGSPDNVTSDDATANTGKAMTSGGVALKPCLTWVLFALLKVVGALETALPSVKEIPEAIPEPVANLYNQLLTVASFSFLFGGLSMIIVLGLYIDELGFRRPGIVGGTIASSNLAFVNNNPACLFSKLFRICQGVGGGGFSLWQVAVIMVLGGLFFASFSVSVALVALYFFQ